MLLDRLMWRNGGVIFNEYKDLQRNSKPKIKIIGITRIRNEEAVIRDTLRHVSKFVDAIIVLDDFSDDNTVRIVKQNKKVIEVLLHECWNENRILEETQHREILLSVARKYNPEWIFYFDADERFEINKQIILSQPENIDGISIRLYDAYMTDTDDKPYCSRAKLLNFRKYFGPEYRDILMIFRNREYIRFEGLDSREPTGCKNVVNKFYCQHYGKALSYEQWEETCDYYSKNFPEPYKTKWLKRKGKALHVKSDFENELYMWAEVKKSGIPLQK